MPTLPSAQQDALLEIRSRYERGEISFDDFRRAFDQIMRAEDAGQCTAVVQALPQSPLSVLDALDRRATPAAPVARTGTRWLISIIGELNRLRRPWRMGVLTNTLSLIGEVNLDLTLAEIPPSGVLRVFSLIGEVNIFVPKTIDVTVHSFALIGEINALGESHAGIFTFCNEEEEAKDHHAGASHLTIQVVTLIGEANIKRVEQPVMLAQRAG
jgi:hypothetical protein